MKAIAIRKEAAPAAAALVGRSICHDLRDEAGRVAVAKGQTLDADAAARLLALPWRDREVHLLELDPGDIHEEPAGSRLAAAACGEHVEVKGYAGGQWTLVGRRRGLVRVNVDALRAVNALEGMSVFTLYDQQPVESGEVVARAKITPLAIPEALVKDAETRAWSAKGLVAVRTFRPHVLGALSRESLAPPQRQRFESSLAEKVDWFGSRLLPVRYAAGDAAAEYLGKLGMAQVSAHEQALTAATMEALADIPGVTLYGPRNPEMKGAVVAFNLEGIHPHDGAALLDQRGIAVRAGHHCAQPLMKCLQIAGTLRASFSVYNTAQDVQRLAEAVATLRGEL